MNIFKLNKSYIKIKLFYIICRLVGKENTYKILFHFKKSYIIRTNLLFIHIPKAAGTSVTNVLYGRRIGHFTLAQYLLYLNNQFSDSIYTFTVVRNPITRIYSAWKFARLGGTEEGAVNNFQKYQQELFATFDSFVMNWLQYQNLNTCEILFRTQCHFVNIPNSEKEMSMEVFYFEKLQELELRLSEKLGKKILFPHKNVVGEKLELTKFNPETIKKLCELYSCDFEKFGYPYPDGYSVK
jgi:hypothetical protein